MARVARAGAVSVGLLTISFVITYLVVGASHQAAPRLAAGGTPPHPSAAVPSITPTSLVPSVAVSTPAPSTSGVNPTVGRYTPHTRANVPRAARQKLVRRAPAPAAEQIVHPKTAHTGKAPVAAKTVNLALGRTVTVSSHTQDYVASNATDGVKSTYWEADAGFPQTLTIDLGSQTTIGRLVMELPTCCTWNSRTQTIAVLGSKDGRSYSQILGPAGYTFDEHAASKDTATVSLPSTVTRFVRLRFTANSGWPDAQMSELVVHSS